MSTITAAAVNELRKKTDLPLMECKKALTEANGDMDAAVLLLRSWFAKAAVKREGNETAEGRIGISIAEEAVQENNHPGGNRPGRHDQRERRSGHRQDDRRRDRKSVV